MISVIMLHHRGDLVHSALASINKSKGVQFETIVVTSVPGLKADATRVVCYNAGPAQKRNVGLRYANGKYIAFFDDDVEVDSTALMEMLKVLKQDGIGMVFGKLLNMEHPEVFDEAGSYLTWNGFLWAKGDRMVDTGQFEKAEPILAGKSASCMIKRRIFVDVGMFDPSFEILGEESDLAWRVWLNGHKVYYVPRSVTLHAFNTKFKTVDFYTHRRVYFNGSKNYISMLAGNLETKNLVRFLVPHIALWLTCSLAMLLRGRFHESSLIFEGVCYAIKNWHIIRIKREKVRSLRRVSDKELFRSIRRNPGLKYYLDRFFRYTRSSVHG